MPKYLNLRGPAALGLVFAILINGLGPMPAAWGQGIVLPKPGAMVFLSKPYQPPLLKGLKIDPHDPFEFNFILDEGDGPQLLLQDESQKLIKYFLASLTTPEKNLWVNLSPYEKNKIIPAGFGATQMGRDLLAEDYLLKQVTASLLYPQGAIGKKFWSTIYSQAAREFGTTDIPVNTFNKVWIVPDKAVVFEDSKAGTAYVEKATFKVMLEEDYLSLQKHQKIVPSPIRGQEMAHQLASRILRQILIPQLTKEVNEGRNFAQLRQAYNSLILATWYKKKIRASIASSFSGKVFGILSIPDAIGGPQQIYGRYIEAFRKGVCNFIKDDIDPLTGQAVPKKYFSGGWTAMHFNEQLDTEPLNNKAMIAILQKALNHLKVIALRLNFFGSSTHIVQGLGSDFIQGLKQGLEARNAFWERDNTKRNAGVALILKEVDGRWYFLLTERPSSISRPGLWVLPGGKIDEQEAIVDGIWREVKEEMGFYFPLKNIVGPLSYKDTKDGYRIFPLVVVMNGAVKLSPNRDEVADEEWMPLSSLAQGTFKVTRGSRRITLNVGEATRKILREFYDVTLGPEKPGRLSAQVQQVVDDFRAAHPEMKIDRARQIRPRDYAKVDNKTLNAFIAAMGESPNPLEDNQSDDGIFRLLLKTVYGTRFTNWLMWEAKQAAADAARADFANAAETYPDEAMAVPEAGWVSLEKLKKIMAFMIKDDGQVRDAFDLNELVRFGESLKFTEEGFFAVLRWLIDRKVFKTGEDWNSLVKTYDINGNPSGRVEAYWPLRYHGNGFYKAAAGYYITSEGNFLFQVRSNGKLDSIFSGVDDLGLDSRATAIKEAQEEVLLKFQRSQLHPIINTSYPSRIFRFIFRQGQQQEKLEDGIFYGSAERRNEIYDLFMVKLTPEQEVQWKARLKSQGAWMSWREYLLKRNSWIYAYEHGRALKKLSKEAIGVVEVPREVFFKHFGGLSPEEKKRFIAHGLRGELAFDSVREALHGSMNNDEAMSTLLIGAVVSSMLLLIGKGVARWSRSRYPEPRKEDEGDVRRTFRLALLFTESSNYLIRDRYMDIVTQGANSLYGITLQDMTAKALKDLYGQPSMKIELPPDMIGRHMLLDKDNIPKGSLIRLSFADDVTKISFLNTMMNSILGTSGPKTGPAQFTYDSVRRNVVINRLLHPWFVNYDGIFNDMINPQGENFTVGVGFPGSDVINLWLTTRFTKAYWIYSKARGRMTRRAFEAALGQWGNLSFGGDYYRQKYFEGYSSFAIVNSNTAVYILSELKAMGAAEVGISQDNKQNVELRFKLPGDEHFRSIEFIEASITKPPQWLSEKLSGRLDAYYEKAAHAALASHLSRVGIYKKWLKPRGFLLINPYAARYRFVEFVDITERVPGLVDRSRDNPFLKAWLNVRYLGRSDHYGWFMQALQNADEAMPAKQVVGQGIRFHKEAIRVDRLHVQRLMGGRFANDGGIDMASTSINTFLKGKEIQLHFDPAMLRQLQEAGGFVPVIISIRPLMDVRQFLGTAPNNLP